MINNSFTNPIYTVFPHLMGSDLFTLKSIAQSRLISGTTLYRTVVDALNQATPDDSENILNLYTNSLKKYLEVILDIKLDYLNCSLHSDDYYFPSIMWSTRYQNYQIFVISGVDSVGDYYATELDKIKEDNDADAIMRLHSLFVINMEQLSKEAELKVLNYINVVKERSALQQIALAEFNDVYPYVSQYLDELNWDTSLLLEYFNKYLELAIPNPTFFNQDKVCGVSDIYDTVLAELLNDCTPLKCLDYNCSSKELIILGKSSKGDSYSGLLADFRLYSQYVFEEEILVLAIYMTSRLNYTITKVYGNQEVPYYMKSRFALSTQLIEYTMLMSGYIIEPQITSYCDNKELLIKAVKDKLQKYEVRDLLNHLRTGYTYSEWRFPKYIRDHNFIVEEDEGDGFTYMLLASNLLSNVLNVSILSNGSRRIVFDLGDTVLKIWVRTDTQQNIEIQFLKDNSLLYSKVLYADEDFILANKSLSLLDLEEDRIYNVDLLKLYHKLKYDLPNYGECKDPDTAQQHIIDYANKCLSKVKTELAEMNYNISDLNSNNVGFDLETGAFKILDAGYTYRLDNPPQLRCLSDSAHFRLERKDSKNGYHFRSISTVPNGRGKYEVRDHSGNRLVSFVAYDIHEYPEVSDACIAVALKDLEDEYKTTHNVLTLPEPYPVINAAQILDKAATVPYSYDSIPVIYLECINGLAVYTCKRYNFNEDTFDVLFKIYTCREYDIHFPANASQIALQTKLSISYGCNTRDLSLMQYDLEEYLLYNGIESISPEQFYKLLGEEEEVEAEEELDILEFGYYESYYDEH